ncbi:MAG: hypothetical protein EA398_12125 [Deltaproteobacteria bacterium]|nr:MAG: hypothetical protein EA398_12125 [Deltaproteobacteria bacterium]
MSDTPRWMIYGANGYTGRLCAEHAVARGDRPVLAGRNESAVRPLAEALGFSWRVFSLDDPAGVRAGIDGMAAVLHTAGPFSATSRPMVDACLDSGAHYLDITGEIAVFEALFARHDEACSAGIAVVPGVGFDVVPTDCMAALLHRWMPTATALDLAFFGLGSLSAGTARSMVESLGTGGLVRRAGALTSVPSGWKTREVPFPSGPRRCTTIPWGDVSTAFHSTAIPDIAVYTHVPDGARRAMPVLDRLRPALQAGVVQRGLKWVVNRTVRGPDAELRQKAFSDVWGEVRNASGDVLRGAVTVGEGYAFTAVAAVAAVRRLLEMSEPCTGALTPSRAFGAEFVLELPDVKLHPFELNGERVTTAELEAFRGEPAMQ